MHPVVDVALAGKALALRDLVLVVRKDIIHATCMDIEMLAQVLHRHRAALDMPAGEATAPGTFPGHLAARFSGFPERKILWIVLLRILALAHTLQHVLKLIARELSIRREALDIKVNILAALVRDA